MPRSPWMVVGLLWVAFLINYVDRQAVFSIYPALQKDLGFSSAELALIGTVFLWTYSLSMPLMGRIADLFRSDRMVVASVMLWSLGTLGTGLSHSLPLFLFWRAVVGLTEALYFPAALRLIAAEHPGATRSRAIATHATAQYAGIFAGGWYGGWMADHLGWRTGFGTLAAVGAGYACVLWLALSPVKATPPAALHSSPLEVLRSRCYLSLCAAFFAFCLMLWMMYAWLPNIIYNRYHLSMSESGFIATIYLQLSSIAGVLLGGFIADAAVKRVRAARFYAAGAGVLLCSPFAYLMLSAGSLTVLKFAAVGFGLTAGLLMSNQFAATYDVTAPYNYGFATGMLNMAGGLAGGAGILSAGLWGASIGFGTLMLWAAIAATLAASTLLAVAARYFISEQRS